MSFHDGYGTLMTRRDVLRNVSNQDLAVFIEMYRNHPTLDLSIMKISKYRGLHHDWHMDLRPRTIEIPPHNIRGWDL